MTLLVNFLCPLVNDCMHVPVKVFRDTKALDLTPNGSERLAETYSKVTHVNIDWCIFIVHIILVLIEETIVDLVKVNFKHRPKVVLLERRFVDDLFSI